jgi:ribosomal 30S subunit maturation factor RimM
MIRKPLVAAFLTAMLAIAPAYAQQQQGPPTQGEVQLVGLPVYSSDGEKLGEVTNVGLVGGEQTLGADKGAFLGLGSKQVLIPADMFKHKVDRIEISMSAAEVKETIAAQQQQKEQKQ